MVVAEMEPELSLMCACVASGPWPGSVSFAPRACPSGLFPLASGDWRGRLLSAEKA